MVRLLLQHLNSPEEAVKVVRETKSTEGAKMVAKSVTYDNKLCILLRFEFCQIEMNCTIIVIGV